MQRQVVCEKVIPNLDVGRAQRVVENVGALSAVIMLDARGRRCLYEIGATHTTSLPHLSRTGTFVVGFSKMHVVALLTPHPFFTPRVNTRVHLAIRFKSANSLLTS